MQPAASIFIQGMRRSGTTILFDLFVEDGSFETWYEPLAAATKPALGGGSGIRDVDYFENVRAARHGFLATRPGSLTFDDLNFGGPGDPALEVADETPEYIRAYLSSLIDRPADTLIKFTRVYNRIEMLSELQALGRLIHVVRDPRAVTASYLFGKNRRNEDRFSAPDVFFGRTSTRTSWSSYSISEAILDRPEYAHLQGCADFMRILVIWAFTYRATRAGGRAHFGDRYLRVRHEDLLNAPQETLRRIYAFLDRPLPDQVIAWAEKNVRTSGPLHEPSDPRWQDGFERLALVGELRELGYV